MNIQEFEEDIMLYKTTHGEYPSTAVSQLFNEFDNKEPMPEGKPDKRLQVTEKALFDFIDTYNAQEVAGKNKYGQLLQAANGRDAYTDILQELADATKYASQMNFEMQALILYIKNLELHREIPSLLHYCINKIINNKRILSKKREAELIELFSDEKGSDDD